MFKKCYTNVAGQRTPVKYASLVFCEEFNPDETNKKVSPRLNKRKNWFHWAGWAGWASRGQKVRRQKVGR